MPTEVVFPAGLRGADARVQFVPIDIARGAPMDQGEQRRRPRFRSVPQVAAVSWRFEQAAFDIFWDWYERELRAGEREFDVELERQGGTGAGPNPRTQWWTAQFVEPPKHDTASGYRYTVSARLMLRGQPVDSRVTTSIGASGTDGDQGFWRVASLGLLAGGTDADGGGWTYINLPIRAQGTDGDTGAWIVVNGLVAGGADGDAGGWESLSTPLAASGSDADSGTWLYTGASASNLDPRVDALLAQANGLVVLRDGALITRTLVPGSNVTISNPAGQAGNPVISSSGGGVVESFRLLTEDGTALLTEDLFLIARESRLNTSQPLQTEQGLGVHLTTEDGNPLATE